jgi:hypothetical protein
LRRAACDWKVRDSEGIEVDVLDIRVGDASQVLGHSRLRANADEEHLRAGTLAADPNLAEPAVIQEPARSVGIYLKPRARQGVGRGRKTLARRGQVAVFALRAVSPEQETSACRQRESDKDPDAAQHNEDDATGAHRNRRTSAGRPRAALHAATDVVATE